MTLAEWRYAFLMVLSAPIPFFFLFATVAAFVWLWRGSITNKRIATAEKRVDAANQRVEVIEQRRQLAVAQHQEIDAEARQLRNHFAQLNNRLAGGRSSAEVAHSIASVVSSIRGIEQKSEELSATLGTRSGLVWLRKLTSADDKKSVPKKPLGSDYNPENR